ncbi:MAG: AbiV family abortive infection protein [Rhodospirillaceae bacterium]
MRIKAIADLSQLNDEAFLTACAEGLSLIHKNVSRLWTGARALHESGQVQASRVLKVLAEEEAGKFLILLDAVRCPRTPSDRFATHLKRFTCHIAKGLYARAVSMRPDTPARLQHYLDNYRDQFYLDGPNDVDWIFPNQIEWDRNGLLYVNYVAHDDGARWEDPCAFEDLATFQPISEAVQLVSDLAAVGFASPAALQVVADDWRPFEPGPETHWSEMPHRNHRTLEQMNTRSILIEAPQDTYGRIQTQWPFPMWGLDLSLRKVDLEDLRTRQRNWTPDGFDYGGW